MKIKAYLRKLGACEDALEWVGDRDLATAWEECERSDWLLWGLGQMIGRKGWPTQCDLVRLAALCARRALRHIPKTNAAYLPAKRAIQAALTWADDPRDDNRRAAAAAADAAAAAAWPAASAAAAWRSEHLALCRLIRKHVTIPARLPAKT